MQLEMTFRFSDPADAKRASTWIKHYIADSWCRGAAVGRTKIAGRVSLFEVGVLTTNQEDTNAIVQEMASGSGEELAQ